MENAIAAAAFMDLRLGLMRLVHRFAKACFIDRGNELIFYTEMAANTDVRGYFCNPYSH